MVAGERVTLLTGGDTVYVYAPGSSSIDDMEAVLNAALPSCDVDRHTLTAEKWDALVRQALIQEGITIIDTRSA